MGCPFTSTSYPVTATLSVASAQSSVTLVAVNALTVSPGGTVGGSVSTTPGVPNTSNSASEYPSSRRHGRVAYTRTKRPKPCAARSSVPPRAVDVSKTVRHQTPSGDVCTRYARAHSAPHVSRSLSTVDIAPRSTDSHWLSPFSPLRQRVAGSPSTAAVATWAAPSSPEAVAGRCPDSRTSPASACAAAGTPTAASARAAGSSTRSADPTVCLPRHRHPSLGGTLGRRTGHATGPLPGGGTAGCRPPC